MHLTLKKETATPPAYTLRDQQRRFDAFRIEFNDHRPHEALGQMTPSMIYQPSARNYSGRTAPVEYPEGSTTRRVQGNGVVYWENKPIFIGEALAREDIAFEPKADGQWEIRFAHIVLGTFDEKKRLFRPKTAWRRRGRTQR